MAAAALALGLRGGEHIGPRAVDEPVDERSRAGDESAGAAERLAERADADIDAFFDAELLAEPAAAVAEYAGRMRLIDQQHCVVLVGQVGEVGQRGEIAVHAEERVGDDQPAAKAGVLA